MPFEQEGGEVSPSSIGGAVDVDRSVADRVVDPAVIGLAAADPAAVVGSPAEVGGDGVSSRPSPETGSADDDLRSALASAESTAMAMAARERTPTLAIRRADGSRRSRAPCASR